MARIGKYIAGAIAIGAVGAWVAIIFGWTPPLRIVALWTAIAIFGIYSDLAWPDKHNA